MLAPNLKPKSMLPLKPKNQLNASPLAPNWVRRVQVGSKNRSKIDQKSMQNPSKINQKSTKNGPKINLGGVSGEPLGALGGQDRKNPKKNPTFAATWCHLGAVLGASWGRLGAWIAVLSRLGPSWGPLEPS